MVAPRRGRLRRDASFGGDGGGAGGDGGDGERRWATGKREQGRDWGAVFLWEEKSCISSPLVV